MVAGVLVFISKDGVGQLSRTVSGEWLGQSHSPRLYPRASQPHTILLRPQSLLGTACRDNKDTKTISLIIIRGTYLKKYSILEGVRALLQWVAERILLFSMFKTAHRTH